MNALSASDTLSLNQTLGRSTEARKADFAHGDGPRGQTGRRRVPLTARPSEQSRRWRVGHRFCRNRR
jgi:hypothetical protein